MGAIEADGIRIRFYEATDIDGLYEAALESIADVYPWLPWCHPGYQRAEAETWILGVVEAATKREQFDFVITDDNDSFIGAVGINSIAKIARQANLGYWIRSSRAGQGITPIAAQLAARWVFENTEIQRLEILAAVGNVRSQRVAEKAGAVREGLLRKRLYTHGEQRDAVLYSIVRGDEAVK